MGTILKRMICIVLVALLMAACQTPAPVPVPSAAVEVVATPTPTSVPLPAATPTPAAMPTATSEVNIPSSVTFAIFQAYHALATDSYVTIEPAKLANVALQGLVQALDIPQAEQDAALKANFTADTDANYKILKERFVTLYTKYGGAKKADTIMLTMVQAMVQAIGDPKDLGYIDQKEVQANQQAANSNYAGIGLVYYRLPDGKIMFIQIFPDGPAAHAGLKQGDLLLKVNNRPVPDNDSELIALIRGPDGSQITFTVQRAGVAQPLELTVTRGKITLPLPISKKLGDTIGYLQISDSTGGSTGSSFLAKRIRDMVAELESQGMKGLIIDFRNNPSESTSTRTISDLASIFTAEDLIVTFHGVDGQEVKVTSTGQALPTQHPIVILTNRSTGALSQSVILSLQEYKAAYVIGQKPEMKLYTQNFVAFDDGSFIYYPHAITLGPVSHQAPQDNTITPDQLVPDRTPEDYASGKDAQLDAAIQYLTGKLAH